MITARPVIAVDGPAGSGKSTLSRSLAIRLGLPYVNTGLMYRALAAAALARHLDPDDEDALAVAASRIRFDLSAGHPAEVWIDGSAPRPILTSAEVEAVVSRVARHPRVREVLRARQRELGVEGSVVEGRDIGTVVFPDADVKLFLSARPEVRARRRVRERGGDGGAGSAVAARDALDARVNPLEPAADAHVLDTTGLDAAAALAEALRVVRARLGEGT
jgi:cytidylate kinase